MSNPAISTHRPRRLIAPRILILFEKEALLEQFVRQRGAFPWPSGRLVSPFAVNRTVVPRRPANRDLRTREYLTEAEVERLMKAATRKPMGLPGRYDDLGGLQARP